MLVTYAENGAGFEVDVSGAMLLRIGSGLDRGLYGLLGRHLMAGDKTYFWIPALLSRAKCLAPLKVDAFARIVR